MGQPIMWLAKCFGQRHAEIGEKRWIEVYSQESRKNMPRNVIGR